MNAITNRTEALHGVTVCFFMELAAVLVLCAWLWILLKHWNLWLRWGEKERAFYLRVGLPIRFVDWCRKCTESKMWIRLVSGLLIVSLAVLAFAVWAYWFIQHKAAA